MSQEYLLDTLGVMNYNRVNLDTNYLGFMIQGKLAFLSQKAIVQNCNLKYIDDLGYRYGKDVILKDKEFEVRTIKSSEIETLIYPIIKNQTLSNDKWDTLNITDIIDPINIWITCQDVHPHATVVMQRLAVDVRISNVNDALQDRNQTTYDLASPPHHQTFRPFLIEK